MVKINSIAESVSTFTINIPKNTATPILMIHEVGSRKLKKIHVVIPSGHKGLAYLQVAIPSLQIVPASGSPDSYIRGENQELDFTPNTNIPGPPYTIMFRGYNLDSFLDHSFIVFITTGS